MEEASANAFGNYTTDFYVTIDGIKNGSFVADEDCYLAGYYPSFGLWVKIPLKGFEIVDGKVYPVITSAGFDFKYTDICGSVQDFICGIHLSDAVLAANPKLNVQLELGLSEDFDAALSGDKFVAVDDPYVYDVEDLMSTVAISGDEYFTSVKAAVDSALESGNSVKIVTNAALDGDIAFESAGDFEINLAGNGLTAGEFKLRVTDSNLFVTNGTRSGFSPENVSLSGSAVLTVTDAALADSFRGKTGFYVSKNANGTHSVMLESAFKLYIAVVDGKAKIGYFQDTATDAAEHVIWGATNLENPDWTKLVFDPAEGSGALPLKWVSPRGEAYRFFKIK